MRVTLPVKHPPTPSTPLGDGSPHGERHALTVLRRGVEFVFWLSKGGLAAACQGRSASLRWYCVTCGKVNRRRIAYAMLRS
jgi:hypothetical protein